MSADDDRISEGDERRGSEALAALRPAPPLEPSLRARLRREFASGAIASAAAPPAARVLPLPRRAFARPWRWALVAAAAAVVAVAVLPRMNAAPPWRLVAATGSGVATVDGRPVPMDDAATLGAALVPGARIRVPDGCALEIASARMVAIRMEGGTDAELPRVPGRWFGRAVSATIAGGEWRITTGDAFHGARLAVATPSAHVEVTGTTLAVIIEPNKGTCVCVYEGRVMVGRDAGDMRPVEQGRRRYVYADRAVEPLEDAMLPHERPALGSFCDAMKPVLRPGR